MDDSHVPTDQKVRRSSAVAPAHGPSPVDNVRWVRWRPSTKRERGGGRFGWANVDLRSNVIYVQSYSGSGLYIANGWIRVLALDVADAELGQAVFEALHNSGDSITAAAEGRERALAALLKAAGVRSYRKYVTGTRTVSVGVRPNSSSITFLPCPNGGPTGPDRGFHPIQDLEFCVPENSTEADVGAATWAALEAAT
jgi:hypothetical protein